jgi:ATPase subunit of ABC transporter with duplicated ATPase domains
MPTHRVKVECRVPDSFEVKVVRGMFDLKAEKTSRQEFNVELPADDDTIDGEPWRIGVIVGPSGSGKSTVARHAYGDRFVDGFEWDPKKAVVANFGGVEVKAVTQAMAAVGFSSPPAWVRPHHVLSGGERFR